MQIIGDEHGSITHLGERECSAQRRNQKVVEIAPAPTLNEELRQSMIEAAVRFAQAQNYQSLGTFEFLLDTSGSGFEFVFIEANARLQVEHTVTEEVTGVDLVQSQIRVAGGESLSDLDLADPATPRGFAIQARVNLETLSADGSVLPSAGTLTAYEPPSGPGVRVDGFGYNGYQTSTAFDSLLAKVIVSTKAGNFAAACAKAGRALTEFRIEGLSANTDFLQNILSHADFVEASIHTRWVDENMQTLAAPSGQRNRFVSAQQGGAGDGFAGARVALELDHLDRQPHISSHAAHANRPRRGADRCRELGLA